jgi:hypothetical protein
MHSRNSKSTLSPPASVSKGKLSHAMRMKNEKMKETKDLRANIFAPCFLRSYREQHNGNNKNRNNPWPE